MKRKIIILLTSVFLSIGCLFVADRIQKDNGNIKVSMESFEMDYVDLNGETKTGTITYKLYVPKTASKDNKASAVLLLHGYQNDHETSAAYALELARRGAVVMAIDEFGHGTSSISMINRGYVNHKVSVNYGTDSKEDGTYKEIGGQTRYKVLMNFSNLSFFNDYYSKDEDGNQLYDSSMGGIAAYKILSEMEMVDNKRMAISGHSMGTWASWSTAAAYSNTNIEPKATVLQAGELFTKDAYDADKIHFNNVLLLTAKYDEFNYFRDYSKQTVNDSVIKNDISSEFLNVEKGSGQWNTTYGNFSDGTARRRQLVITNHRLVTHDKNAIATTMDWLSEAIGFNNKRAAYDQTFMIKEVLVLVATLITIFSCMVLMSILLDTAFFKSLAKPELISLRVSRKGMKYWKPALITILIAFITYPFCTQLGHGLLPLPDTTIFRMTIGNGFLAWYLILIVIMLITNLISALKAKKNGAKLSCLDMGLAAKENSFGWGLMFKGLIMASLMMIFMYVQCFLIEKIFMLDYRFIWPFFKSFTGTRFVQFLIYLPIFLLFFVLNNSKIFAANQPSGAEQKGLIGFIRCWYKNALCMIGGVLLLIVLEYTPFFMGLGPGADLLFSSTFGGPFMSLMIVFVPQVLVFSLICTYAYRKTGSVFTGAFFVAMLACWIVTGGSAIL
ncbi:MAG: hypothetical protein Q4B60_08655 [Erysipelotrichaceae bacterium]|nr:hypothetical protein [Erysipelotrichaceae bacterium]